MSVIRKLVAVYPEACTRVDKGGCIPLLYAIGNEAVRSRRRNRAYPTNSLDTPRDLLTRPLERASLWARRGRAPSHAQIDLWTA